MPIIDFQKVIDTLEKAYKGKKVKCGRELMTILHLKSFLKELKE